LNVGSLLVEAALSRMRIALGVILVSALSLNIIFDISSSTYECQAFSRRMLRIGVSSVAKMGSMGISSNCVVTS
jgi:hypothetical protein